MNGWFINPPELAARVTIEKGFISFFDRKGKCLGRRDTDYVSCEYLDTVMASARGLGSWVHTMYLKLIWKPLAKLTNMNTSAL